MAIFVILEFDFTKTSEEMQEKLKRRNLVRKAILL
jgi:hypothetical protein